MATSNSVFIIGSTGSVGRHVVHVAAKRGLAIRALSRDADHAAHTFAGIPDVDVVQGDATDPASLAPLVADAGAVILTHGDDSRAESVNYGVVPALLEALDGREPRVALMSSINVTSVSGPYADLLLWKRRGERLLRAAGLPYTIVRPGWFDSAEVGDDRVIFAQGDTASMGTVRREHVAQTLVEAILTPSAAGRTVEVFSGPGTPIADWEALFASVHADTPGSLDGALDSANLPVESEPARVVADLERFRTARP